MLPMNIRLRIRMRTQNIRIRIRMCSYNKAFAYAFLKNTYSHSHSNAIMSIQLQTRYINDLTTTVSMYKYVDDSTKFEICEFGGTSVIQESVDIATMWTIRNKMQIKSEKSKEMVICYAHGANTIHRVPSTELNE